MTLGRRLDDPARGDKLPGDPSEILVPMLRGLCICVLRAFVLFAVPGVLLAMTAGAHAGPIRIVAVGASNTWGWGVNRQHAYPAQLQAMLRAKGYNVEVRNAGVNFDTTNGMLARLDAAVPAGTDIVILQPGGNDLRFLGTRARRTANINAMVERLRLHGIKSIVYDPEFAPRYYQWDLIHINAEGHAMIATSLFAEVVALIGPSKR
jgi:acyl-CoA thioesterase-1